MLLRFYKDPQGKRVYSLKEVAPDGAPTYCAHPGMVYLARFSPDDPFSQERILCKKRFNLLLTQQPKLEF
jgi:H/ACA ribonucleoprotein complex subunit 3